jgi:hypothetical protein
MNMLFLKLQVQVYKWKISDSGGRWNLYGGNNSVILFTVLCYNMESTIPYFLLCSLVVRVSGYRSWGPGFDSQRYQIFWEVVGLERSPLSLVRTTKELLEWKSSGSGLGNRKLTAVGIHCADHATPSIR